MRRLTCTFVVRIWHTQVSSWRGSFTVDWCIILPLAIDQYSPHGKYGSMVESSACPHWQSLPDTPDSPHLPCPHPQPCPALDRCGRGGARLIADPYQLVLLLPALLQGPTRPGKHFSPILNNMNHLLTKPTKWVCAQRRLRSAWASAQSDQSLRCPNEEAWTLSYPLSAQQRLWSDWEDAQADLSLRWAHSHIVGFVTRRLIYSIKLHPPSCMAFITLSSYQVCVTRKIFHLLFYYAFSHFASLSYHKMSRDIKQTKWLFAQSDQSLRCALNG